MTYEEIKDRLATLIPFNSHIGIEIVVIGDGTAQACLPKLRNNTNHLGLIHAAATFGVGEAAARVVDALNDGDVALLENTRFHKGEEKNAADFVEALAANGDIFVSDAFSAAHRAHASTEGIAHRLPAFAGRAMQAELEALESALAHPERPVMAIVGGAKVSTKLELLGNLVAKVDYLVIGGGMANTFLAAQGKAVGKSLCEHDLAGAAREILAKAEKASARYSPPHPSTDGPMAPRLKAGTTMTQHATSTRAAIQVAARLALSPIQAAASSRTREATPRTSSAAERRRD